MKYLHMLAIMLYVIDLASVVSSHIGAQETFFYYSNNTKIVC